MERAVYQHDFSTGYDIEIFKPNEHTNNARACLVKYTLGSQKYLVGSGYLLSISSAIVELYDEVRKTNLNIKVLPTVDTASSVNQRVYLVEANAQIVG